MKSVLIRSFSDPYFPTFGLNKKRYYDTFSRDVCLQVTAHIDIKIGSLPNLCELPENVNSLRINIFIGRNKDVESDAAAGATARK